MKRLLASLLLIQLLTISCAQKATTPESTSTDSGVQSPTTSTATTNTTNPSKADAKDQQLNPRGIDYGSAPERIAFGSCANQDNPQPIWDTIAKTNPDLFLFMGDNIYGSRPEQKPISEQYKKLNRIPEYRSIREKVPFMAIWDDHDFGENDGGADYVGKEAAKKDFLKNWPYVKDSISLGQGGLYHAKLIGGTTVGKKKRQKFVGPQIQVIMLDTRYYRSPLKKAENPTDPLHKFDAWENDKSKVLLGEEQWSWLEEQLKRPAEVRFIVSSIQLIANAHHFEKWGNFPHEQERFYNLLKKTGAKNVIILSGDRHIGTIAKTEIKGWGTLYDITASSINRTANFEETDPSYVGTPYKGENFGLATIDLKKRIVHIELRDIENKVMNGVEIKLH